jgi:hypothetical protein
MAKQPAWRASWKQSNARKATLVWTDTQRPLEMTFVARRYIQRSCVPGLTEQVICLPDAKTCSDISAGFRVGILSKDTSRHCLYLSSALWLLFYVTERNKEVCREHNYFATNVSPCTRIVPTCTHNSSHLQQQQNGDASLSIRPARHIAQCQTYVRSCGCSTVTENK